MRRAATVAQTPHSANWIEIAMADAPVSQTSCRLNGFDALLYVKMCCVVLCCVFPIVLLFRVSRVATAFCVTLIGVVERGSLGGLSIAFTCDGRSSTSFSFPTD